MVRSVLLTAAVAMGVVEVVATFVEARYAIVLAALLLLVAAWFWRRNSLAPAGLLALLFLLEIVYLGDYDWADAGDRMMIALTVAVSGIGLVAAVVWLVQALRRRSRT